MPVACRIRKTLDHDPPRAGQCAEPGARFLEHPARLGMHIQRCDAPPNGRCHERAAPGTVAEPEWQLSCRCRVRFDQHFARAHAHDAPASMAQLHQLARRRLEREFLVKPPDPLTVVQPPNLVLEVLGNHAGVERQQAAGLNGRSQAAIVLASQQTGNLGLWHPLRSRARRLDHALDAVATDVPVRPGTGHSAMQRLDVLHSPIDQRQQLLGQHVQRSLSGASGRVPGHIRQLVPAALDALAQRLGLDQLAQSQRKQMNQCPSIGAVVGPTRALTQQRGRARNAELRYALDPTEVQTQLQ